VHYKVPIGPSDINWEEHFPEIYEKSKESGREPPRVAFADVGCGFGGMTVKLAEEYPDKLVVGMEIRQKVSGRLGIA